MVSPAYHLRWKTRSTHCFGRHETGFFGRKVDAGFVADAEFVAVVRQTIDAQLHANGVEEDVAGFQDGVVKIGGAVRSGAFFGEIDPTFELAAVKSAVARGNRW